ncbi:MAG: outer membrane beta-barrel protein [Pseudomonadota bacterium]|nr:outer membrane beta-barrel protein [Pseudomonadota bacterium]
MLKFLFGITFGGLMIAGTAFAADVKNSPAPAFDWSGGYVGVDFGAAMNNSNWFSPANPPQFNTNGTGLAAGGVVGFRHQMNNLVLGVEGSADLLTVDGEANCVGTFPTCVTKESFIGMLQANVGFATGRVHLYGTGGAAYGSFEHYEKISVNQSWGGESRLGWTVGAGLDYAVSDHVTAGVRWNYYDFGTKTISPPFPVNFTENGNLVTARIEYKF